MQITVEIESDCFAFNRWWQCCAFVQQIGVSPGALIA